ncbi:Energy-coupling factor transporter transmembrane protein EcfT [Sporomusa ovata DSM 2662]|uniref:Transmembrane component of general energizing module of ECF transporters n=1 Tax=Sporomusa ovata TaxID=2378 RepID=A0A0U1KS73_9FIRM|nr:CbiQ family ECF transporter T component [Sporomusa ovata]EQB24909.1 ABC-type cobalt transport system, permease component CbiQ [Sporomusa ovata DSM 2662]CQR70105.1 Transmembrane component of general energizing module of ECF transporters [Sporomusa ovata]
MKDIKLGQFVLGSSFLYRLDPRTKIISCLLITFSVLFDAKWFVLLYSTLLIMAAIILSRLKLKTIMRGLRKLSLMLVMTFTAQLLLTKGNPLLHVGPVSITQEGIELGITTLFRLLILYLCSSLLTMTTSPVSLATGIEALLAPLRYVKIPVHQFAMIIGTAFRFIPTILEEAESITRAQRARGAPFNSPNLITRLKSMTAVLIPLLAASLQRADDLAMAMASRCYAGSPNHFRMRNLSLARRDNISLLVVGLLVIVPFFL